MTLDPTNDPMNDPMYGRHASHQARYVFAYLHQRGGSMRLGPLLRQLRIEPATFIAAVNELVERYWIAIVWHKAPQGTPDDEPRPFTDIDRLVTTRFGRKKVPHHLANAGLMPRVAEAMLGGA
jgi:hypothetical protein